MSKLPEMPEALLGGDDGRRKLVSRAIVGAVLIAVLLGLLSYFEHVPGPADKEGSPVSTIPPIDGPVASGVATAGGDQPQMPERAPDEPPMVQQAALAVAAEPEESHGPEIAAPGERVADAPATTADARPAAPSKGGRLVLQGEALAAEPDAAALSAPVTARPTAARSAARRDGFLLQLGVFSTPSNAQALYDDLRRQGIPARLETRVVAGPFEDKAAAEAARRKLVSAGLEKGILVRDAAPR